ncbi:MAG: DUF2125 domain-containing protein [Candidatus Saccharibacteria bacterium]|nr:DUF2125 domain-containing protein [Pseudorhodobacter sp.]
MLKSGHALTVAIAFTGQTLWADVTPDDIWLAWQTMAQSQGQKITSASTETVGDTLTVKGITLTLTNEFGAGSASLPDLQFQDNGDGTVAILVPDSFPVRLMLPKDSATAQPAEFDLTVAVPGAKITASGVPGAINYEQSLPSLEITAKGTNTGEQSDVTLNMSDVKAKYRTEAGESGQNLSAAFSADSLTIDAAGTDDAGARTDINLSLADLDGTTDLTGIPVDDGVEFESALAAGFTFDGAVTYGIGALVLNGNDAGEPFKLASTLGGGNLTLGMDAGKFHYDATNKSLSLNASGTDKASGGDFTFAGSMADFSSAVDIKGAGWTNTEDFNAALRSGMVMAVSAGVGGTSIDFAGGPADGPVKLKGSLAGMQTSFALSSAEISSDFRAKALTVTIASPDIPVPELSADLGELAFGLVMPAAPTSKPAPFTFVTKMIDLKLPEALWAMVDPTAILPHDPATVIVDTNGTATLTKDLMADAQSLENGATDAPGVVNSLKIPQILAKALGTEIAASGAFTFDASDTVTFSGMPLPTGKIDIKATGVNALIDKLVSMGLVPQDQAMQGRMMLSMFANSSATNDEITSTLEFKDKHFFANGQQLQ